MYYLMQNNENSLPVIVSGESRHYAELASAGYIPIAQGYRKQLEELERDMMEDIVMELELNNEIN